MRPHTRSQRARTPRADVKLGEGSAHARAFPFCVPRSLEGGVTPARLHRATDVGSIVLEASWFSMRLTVLSVEVRSLAHRPDHGGGLGNATARVGGTFGHVLIGQPLEFRHIRTARADWCRLLNRGYRWDAALAARGGRVVDLMKSAAVRRLQRLHDAFRLG